MDSPFPSAAAFVERHQPPDGPLPLRPEEQDALGGASSPRRRAQFALGRACARDALLRLGARADVAIGRETGRLPRWPAGYVGSITHSHDRAAAAVALADAFRSLGVDLERTRRPSDALLARVTRPAERETLRALPASELPLAFTALFAAKESLYKAVNPLTGTYLGFGDAEVRFAPGTDWRGDGGGFAWSLHKDCGALFPLGAGGAGAMTGWWPASGFFATAPREPTGAALRPSGGRNRRRAADRHDPPGLALPAQGSCASELPNTS
jgi:4'-phosphopantetheinyl transferase EntD